MPFTTSGRARIYFEDRGKPGDIPLLMIQGYTAQLVGWRNGFIDKLIARAIRPILFDNRDVGLSEMMGGETDYESDYTLDDLGDDAIAVLDELGLGSCHIAGQSMGGMIAQNMMIRHPARVASSVLIYTTAGRKNPEGAARQSPIAPVVERLPRDVAIAAYVERERLCSSTDYPFDEAWIRELGGIAYDRSYAPEGNARQWSMLQKGFDFRDGLQHAAMPTAIIHGRADALIPASASFELGRLLPSSEVHIFPGMGHEIVPALWDEFAEIIHRTMRRAQS